MRAQLYWNQSPENLFQMAAEPNQTQLKSLKLHTYRFLICACCHQILIGLPHSHQGLLCCKPYTIPLKAVAVVRVSLELRPGMEAALFQTVRELQLWFILVIGLYLLGSLYSLDSITGRRPGWSWATGSTLGSAVSWTFIWGSAWAWWRTRLSQTARRMELNNLRKKDH